MTRSIPRKFTCDGGSINPEFQIQNVPEDAGELGARRPRSRCSDRGRFRALGSLEHRSADDVDQRGERAARLGRRSERCPPRKLHGSCPPPGHGVHHYHFKLYASGYNARSAARNHGFASLRRPWQGIFFRKPNLSERIKR